jgi:hypothetical protein
MLVAACERWEFHEVGAHALDHVGAEGVREELRWQCIQPALPTSSKVHCHL